MKKLVLAIQSYPGANAAVARHWAHYERAGADEIIGIGTTDGGCVFPEKTRQLMIGANLYISGNHLPLRLINTIQAILKLGAEWVGVIEYDVLFFKPIPRDLPLGLTTHLAGAKPEGCRCNAFFHGPWIADKETAAKLVTAGQQIIAERIGDPSPDCFLGQAAERSGIKVHTDILRSYSRNTIHGESWINEARAAIAAGAVAIHGVKDEQVFRRITE